MKVVPLQIHPRLAKGIAEAGLPLDPEPMENEEEDATASSAAASSAGKRKARPRMKRPSPVAVIARALNGYSHPPTDPVTIIAQAIERPPQGTGEIREPVFWDIWLAHRSYLRAHALRFSGGNLSDAEDAMSEAMLKAANAFTKTVVHNERGWLLRLVHNACMDHHRNNRRQRRLATDIGDDDAQAAPAFAIQPERSPEELLVAMQKIGGLERALNALPKFLAEPLMLHLDERSDAEIAETLSLSREVVRKRRQMARALLRQSVDF